MPKHRYILVSCFLSGYIMAIFQCTCGLQKSVGFPFHFFWARRRAILCFAYF